MQVDERVARCFALLRNPEFKPLLDYLTKRRQETLERLGEANESQVGRLQGRSAELKELLELVEKAEAIYAKIRGN